MKRLMTTMCMATAVLASGVQAGQVRLIQVPHNAKWVVHFDVEAFRKSSFGNGMMDILKSHEQAIGPEKVARAVALWNKLGDVRDITLYGHSYTKKIGVGVFNVVRYDQREIKKLVGVDDTAPPRAHGKHAIYTFVPRRGPRKTQYLCLYSPRVIVAGGRFDLVTAAIDLLDGKGNSMSQSNPLAALLEPRNGAFMVAAGLKMDEAVPAGDEDKRDRPRRRKWRHPGALLRKAETARAEFGQRDADLYAQVEMAMKTEQDATNLNQVALGLVAMLRLKAENGEKSELAKLADGIKIERKGKRVTMTVAYPTADALDHVRRKVQAKASRAK